MKRLSTITIAALAFATALHAADTSGIKEANLKGADVALMDDHDPASQLEHFDLLPGYQVNLFASEPMLANPVHMHWDSRGRLWVACSWAYPQLEPGDVAADKIIILEDTDADGAADKSTVFADGLYVPTGLELANGGCYVGQSPDIFFLRDTDGDDVADVKELALTGFGIEDSHHSISAWRRGPGGWIYFQEGIFLHAQVETQYGVVRNFNGGVYQFNPRTQELRVFCTGTGGNPWGHVFDRWGQSFMVNNPRIMYLSPATGNSGRSVPVSSLISTEKQCGGDFATGSHISDDIRGQLLTGRFKSRAVVRYEFIEDGAGFDANVLEPLISSRHPNFRPVDVKVGPDGAIYVADWYNSIINHAQHDFRDPRRDHAHGRIWRITRRDRPLVEPPQLVGESIETLVSHLASPEDWVRHQVRKELSERNPKAVQEALEAWVESLSPELPDYDHHLVEAMWACQNVGRVSEPILTRVLNANSGHARSAGARVLRYWHQELSDPIEMIAQASGDSFARTRMEAVLSAGFVPNAQAYAAALHAIDQPGDPLVEQALEQTTLALDRYWRPALEAGTLAFARPEHRAYVERSAGIGFSDRLATFLTKPSSDPREIAAIRDQLIASASDADARRVLAALSRDAGTWPADATIALLEGVKNKASNRASKKTQRAAAGLRTLLDHQSEAVACLAAENLGAWRAPQVGQTLLALIESDQRSARLRRTAAVALAKLGATEHVEALSMLANEGAPESRYAAATGLAEADLERGLDAASRLLVEDPMGSDPVPFLQALLSQRQGARDFAARFEGVQLHPDVVTRVAQFHRSSGFLPRGVSRFFQPPTDDAEPLSATLLGEDQDRLAADVVEKGDPHRGEMIYRRSALACTSCHAIGPAGPEIAPNLVAVGAAATAEYMIESILAPNAAIAEHYENHLFTLTDGSVQMGVITFQSETETIVRDAAQGGKEVRLAAADIQRQQPMPSLMPAGLADQLQSRQEFLDLAKFLSVLGRPGDFANDERPVLRKWRLVAAPSDGSFADEAAAWLPAYAKVDGELPAEDLALVGDQVLARAWVEVQVAGKVGLKLNDPTAIALTIDGAPVENLATPLSLDKGRHELTFSIDIQRRNSRGLRVELEAADTTVRFQPEGGL